MCEQLVRHRQGIVQVGSGYFTHVAHQTKISKQEQKKKTPSSEDN
jgi:hypothetical protein